MRISWAFVLFLVATSSMAEDICDIRNTTPAEIEAYVGWSDQVTAAMPAIDKTRWPVTNGYPDWRRIATALYCLGDNCTGTVQPPCVGKIATRKPYCEGTSTGCFPKGNAGKWVY